MQAYADWRVQQPDYWPADLGWSTGILNQLDSCFLDLDALFLLLHNRKQAKRCAGYMLS